jgi:hypothetical protein
MFRQIVDFSRKSCTRMAGGCPGYGSGGAARSRNVATVSQVPRRMVVERSKEEEQMMERMFRDVS